MAEPAFARSPAGQAALRLFCFPFAGGNGSTFRAWPEIAGVSLCAVELPGRQARFGERPHRRMDNLVSMLLAELGPQMEPPFALFGHSMGALIAYALAVELRRRGMAQPCHLLVSGRGAPYLRRGPAPLHRLTDGALVRRLLPGVRRRADPAVLELMLPTLRADVELAETYLPLREPPLPMPISAFAGADDPAVSDAALNGWAACTQAAFARRRFPGGHQYLIEQAPALTAAIGHALADAGPAGATLPPAAQRETGQ